MSWRGGRTRYDTTRDARRRLRDSRRRRLGAIESLEMRALLSVDLAPALRCFGEHDVTSTVFAPSDTPAALASSVSLSDSPRFQNPALATHGTPPEPDRPIGPETLDPVELGPVLSPPNWVALAPVGSLVYQASVSHTITGVKADQLELPLDGPQTLSLVVRSDAQLQSQVILESPGKTTIATGAASVAGESVILQNVAISTSGTYRLYIQGQAGTLGDYEVELVLNAAIDAEQDGGPANDSLATAQDIDGSSLLLGGGLASRAAVLGRRGLDLAENFEGPLSDAQWLLTSSLPAGLNQVTSDFSFVSSSFTAAGGDNALLMGLSSGSTPNLNEATWTVDLSGVTAAQLTFSHADLRDEQNVLPTTFTGHANGDGVAMSADGITWYRLLSVTAITENQWHEVTLDLKAAADNVGIALGENFQIRFQQYDDSTLGSDGRAFDEIRITTVPAQSIDDWYSFSLNDGEIASLSLQESGRSFGTTLKLYDAAQNLLATGIPATELAQAIPNFQDQTSNGVPDTYYVLIDKPADEYVLLLTQNADFDREQNDALGQSQGVNPSNQLLGEVSGSANSSLAILQSFAGPDYTSLIPPDPILAVGPSQVVAMVNTEIAIYDKATGSPVFSQSISGSSGFFANVGAQMTVFDPWIIFDDQSGRFFIAAIDITSASESHLYLAVSTTSTPTSGAAWHKYRLDFTHNPEPAGLGTSTHFADYPKLSANADAIFVSGNYFPIAAGTGVYAGISAIDKTPLLSGGPANIVYQDFFDGFGVFPLNQIDSSSIQYFAEARNADTIRLHAITETLTTPQRTTFNLTVPAFLEPLDVPQLSGSTPLDSIDSRIMTGVWRNGSAWFAHSIREPSLGDDEAVARWYEVDTNSFPSGTPTLVQSGNVDPGPELQAWMPALAVDGNDNLAIGFSLAGSTLNASAAFTGRLASDPAGTTVLPVVTYAAGEGSYSLIDSGGRNRWGDYSGLVVDPSDDATFWVFNEYAASNGLWATQVASFQLEPTAEIDVIDFEVLSGDSLTIQTFTPLDGPLDPLNDLDPALALFDPSGQQVFPTEAVAADGRNVSLTYTAPSAGTYRLEVSAELGEGTYFVSIQGATAGNLPPTVIDANPDDGAALPAFPAVYRLVFSEVLSPGSVQASDLLVNGTPATSVTVSGATLEFTLDPLVDVGTGSYSVELAAGAVSDLQGFLNLAFNASFDVDITGPRITATTWNGNSFPLDARLAPGSLAFEATLDEDIFVLASARRGPLSPGSDDILLRELTTGLVLNEQFVSYDPNTDRFRAEYGDLPEGNYQLTMFSGPGAFADNAGNALDGEPLGPNPDKTITGDSVPGGNYFIDFRVDSVQQALDPFQRVEPLGGLIAESLNNEGLINETGDVDTFTFVGQAGQVLAGQLRISGAVIATLTLLDESGDLVPPISSDAPGFSVALPPTQLPADGTYRLQITADAMTHFRLDAWLNASIESHTGDTDEFGGELAIDDSFVSLGSGRWAVVGTSEKKIGFTKTNDPLQFIDISSTGTPIPLEDDDQVIVATTVGNELLPAGVITIGSNGLVAAGLAGNLFFQNLPLPALGFGQLLVPYWDDLDDVNDLPTPVFMQETQVGGINTLIIQWHERPHFEDIGAVTFQVQVFESGPVLARFAYQDIEFGDPMFDFGGSSTIGYQASDELGFEYNFGYLDAAPFDPIPPSNPVANGDVVDLFPQDDVDEYTLDLSARVGQRIDILLKGLEGLDLSGETLQLLAPNGSVIATGVAQPLGIEPTDFDLGIFGFTVQDIGSNQYTVRIESGVLGPHTVVVTDAIQFESEPNQAFEPLRSLNPLGEALGYLGAAGDTDRLTLAVQAGETVVVRAVALFDDPAATPLNDLDAALQILAGDGSTLRASDLSSLDGKNPQVAFIAPASETLTVVVTSTSGRGEYRLTASHQPTDFGDAPASFGTLAINSGASHIASGPKLGSVRDTETDGIPSPTADGDDLDPPAGSDDEDGVTLEPVVPGQISAQWTVNVQDAPKGAKLDAWVDFDGNGSWSASERIADGLSVISGENVLAFDVPSASVTGLVAARFRLSTLGISTPTGIALDGEVEDYAIEIRVPPQVESIVVDDSTSQRSMVRSLTVLFNTIVSLDADALTLEKVGGSSVELVVDPTEVGGKSVAIVTFTGVDIKGGSLPDGNYVLTVHGDRVHVGRAKMAADVVDSFFRLFGDAFGNRAVGLDDFNALRTAFGTTPPNPKYNDDLDYFSNNVIGLDDFNAFRSRFGTTLPPP